MDKILAHREIFEDFSMLRRNIPFCHLPTHGPNFSPSRTVARLQWAVAGYLTFSLGWTRAAITRIRSPAGI